MPATPSVRLTDFQRAVAVGTLLGDSSLSTPSTGKNAHLSCYHAIAQREWLTQKHGWLQPASRPIQWCSYIDKRDGKDRAGGRFHTVSIPCFTDLKALLYRGRTKWIGPAFLELFTEPVSLACLICDDGSWDGGGIAISTKQFTVADNERLAERLRDFRLSVSVQRNGMYPYVRITASSVQRARDLCFPFVPESLRYKFGPDGYQTTLVGKIARLCALCDRSFQSYASSRKRFCGRKCADKGKPKRWTNGRASPRIV